MHKFRSHRYYSPKKESIKIDGFIRPSSEGLNRIRKPADTGSLSNFRRPEGFYASDILSDNEEYPKHTPSNIKDQFEPTKKPKKSLRQHLSLRKLGRRSLNTLLLVLLVGFGYMFGKGYLNARQIFQGGGSAVALENNVDPIKLNGEGDGRVNILMVGKGGLGHEAPDLTDTILILSIDPLQKESAVLSIPRDLWVATPEQGSMKINAVFANKKYQFMATQSGDNLEKRANDAGMAALKKVIHENIGIPMHYWAAVDFDGFEHAIDTVGGVTLNAPDPVYEVMYIDGRPYLLDIQPGLQSFDGFRALAYVRSRYTSPRGDFDRSERQRLLLIALKEKIFSAGTYSNPIKINQLFDNFGDHMSTNLTINELLRLYEIGGDISGDSVKSLGLADPPNNFVITGNIGGQSVVIPRAGVGNFSNIQSFVRNTLKDGFLVNENAVVAVLNGTNIEGLAGRTATELESFGYNISQIDNSPIQDVATTLLVDLRGGLNKYTQKYLENRFGVMAMSTLPDPRITPGEADFVIILGRNEVNRLQN